MMKCFARMVGYAATVLALSIVLFRFAGTWFGEQGSVLQFAGNLVYQRRCNGALQYRCEVVQHAMNSKTRIITELLDERLDLREAIVQFQRINEQFMENIAVEGMDQELIASYLPGPTDAEGVGRLILAWIRADVAVLRSDKTEHRLVDLERAFQKLFGTELPPDASTDFELKHLEVGCNRGSRFETQ